MTAAAVESGNWSNPNTWQNHIVPAANANVLIPGQPYSFGKLLAAQATGDLQSLRSRGRRIARVHLADLERA